MSAESLVCIDREVKHILLSGGAQFALKYNAVPLGVLTHGTR